MSKARERTVRFVGFTSLALLMCLVTMFVIICPATNPRMLDSIFFHPEPPAQAGSSGLVPLNASEADKVVPTARHKMQDNLSDDDFQTFCSSKPEHVRFTTADGIGLHGWFFTNPTAKDTLIYNCSGRHDMRFPILLVYIKAFSEANLSVLIYDYRGFGRSEGPTVNTDTVLLDANAAYDYLVNDRKVAPEHLVLAGRNMGAYVACQIATLKPCRALILEDVWVDIKGWLDESLGVLPMHFVPLSFYPRAGLTNLPYLQGKHAPALFVSTSEHEQVRKAFELASEPKQYVQLKFFAPSKLPNFADDTETFVHAIQSFLMQQ